jgi:hypothetical protein
MKKKAMSKKYASREGARKAYVLFSIDVFSGTGDSSHKVSQSDADP